MTSDQDSKADAPAAVAPAATVLPDDLQTIGPSDLGKLIGRSTKTVKVDASRRPDTLPPRFIVPGTRKLLWRVADVRKWMQMLADIEAEKRLAEREFARSQGITGPLARKPFVIAKAAAGKAARARMDSVKE